MKKIISILFICGFGIILYGMDIIEQKHINEDNIKKSPLLEFNKIIDINSISQVSSYLKVLKILHKNGHNVYDEIHELIPIISQFKFSPTFHLLGGKKALNYLYNKYELQHKNIKKCTISNKTIKDPLIQISLIITALLSIWIHRNNIAKLSVDLIFLVTENIYSRLILSSVFVALPLKFCEIHINHIATTLLIITISTCIFYILKHKTQYNNQLAYMVYKKNKRENII